MNGVLDKLADFFITLAVAAVAVALFQGELDKALPGVASPLFGVVLAIMKGFRK